MKEYNRDYYKRWYHDPATRIASADLLERKVRLALAAAEFMLGRKARSVLDIRCGGGAWAPVLRRLRRGIAYTGIESSEYVVRRFGKRRNIRLGSFGRLDRVRLRGP